jgi:hypothetical protein
VNDMQISLFIYTSTEQYYIILRRRDMSQLCAIPKCERTVRGLCDCCKQKLCLQHLNEHNTLLISELNPLIDEINAVGD